MHPMLATAPPDGAGPPAGPEWVHEVKWDGIRLLADVQAGRLRLLTRSGRDIAVAFPELVGLTGVADDVLLEGEAIALVAGTPSFAHVVERVHTSTAQAARLAAGRHPATYVAFDLLRLDGLDLTALPWTARRSALTELVSDIPNLQVSPVYPDGAQLLGLTRAQGLEGVVSKRRSAPYRPGVRSGDWLKFPHRARFTVVIGGWRGQTGRTSALGTVHVGLPLPDTDGMPQRTADGTLRLAYLGRVGSGLAGRAGESLLQLLTQLPPAPYPFDRPIPADEERGSVWVQPHLVIDVAALGINPAGHRLRQPSYQGLRADLEPRDLLEQR